MREHDRARQLRAVPDNELAIIRRDLQATIAMMRHGSPMQAPATAYLGAVTAELDRRAREPASPP